MMSNIETTKENIVESYMKGFKQELSFFEKIMVKPISNKMKEILKSDKKIEVDNLKDLEDLGFWRKVLGIKIGDKILFENLTGKVFGFLKEKQEKIIQAETEGRLDELEDLVINGKLDELDTRLDGLTDDSVGGESGGENGGESEGESGGENGGESEGEGGGENGGESEGESGGENGGESEGEGGGENGGESEGEGGGENGGENGGESDEGGDSAVRDVLESAAVSGGGMAAWQIGERTGEKVVESIREVPENFDIKSARESMQNLKASIDNEISNMGSKMSTSQKKALQKSSKEFEKSLEAAKDLGDDEIKKMYKFWVEAKSSIPEKMLVKYGTDKALMKSLQKLSNKELEILIGKNTEAAEKLLSEKGLKVSKELLMLLRQEGKVVSVQTARNTLKLLENGSKLARFARGLKAVPFVGLAFLGFDYWTYLNDGKEAELLKKVNEVKAELKHKTAWETFKIMGVGTLAVDILLTAALGAFCVPGAGWIVGGVILVGTLVYMRLHGKHDQKRDFYSQNRYEFISQKRIKVKQAIVQLIESDRKELDKGIKEDVEELRGSRTGEKTTIEHAWEALIFQEELEKGYYSLLRNRYNNYPDENEFLKGLSEDDKKLYNEQKQEMENIIKLRMEYVNKFMNKGENAKDMKDAISGSKGLSFISKVLSESAVYADLKKGKDEYLGDLSNIKDIQEYKTTYEQKLKEDYPREFEQFESLRTSNPLLLREICLRIEGFLFDKENFTEEEYQTMEKNKNFIIRYGKYWDMSKTMEEELNVRIVTEAPEIYDNYYIEQILKNISSVDKRPTMKKEETLNYITCNSMDIITEQVDNEVSDMPFQNALYCIAKEVHGYTGPNQMFDLIQFYNEADGDTLGVYYSDQFKVTRVGGLFGTADDSIDEGKVLSITQSQAINMLGLADVESVVGAADDKIKIELRRRMLEIVCREYGYVDKKKEYEESLVKFINDSVEKGSDTYVDIPWYLVIPCKKSGIGDVEKYIFTVNEQGKIVALSRGDLRPAELDLSKTNTKVEYNATCEYNALSGVESDSETQENADLKKLIDEVDAVKNKLGKLRSKQGGLMGTSHEDDLDLNVELERHFLTKKVLEWEKIKESHKYKQSDLSKQYIKEKALEYYTIFNGMYIGLLNEVTNKNHNFTRSNDVDDAEAFSSAADFMYINVVSVEKGKIKYNDRINDTIKDKYLPKLLDLYKDKETGKTIKELILDKDNEDNATKGIILANRMYTLCLEEAVLSLDENGNVTNITKKDMGDDDFEKVKNNMYSKLEGQSIYELIENFDVFVYGPEVKQKPKIRKVLAAEMQSRNNVIEVVKKIISTKKDVDWGYKRGNPEFIADEKEEYNGEITGVLKSWGYSERVTVKMKNDETVDYVKIDKLNYKFTNAMEGFSTANLINFIRKESKKHPYGSDAPKIGHFKKYHWSNGGDLERDVAIDMGLFGDVDSPDVDIVEEDTLKKCFPTINKSGEFLKYINSFVKK